MSMNRLRDFILSELLQAIQNQSSTEIWKWIDSHYKSSMSLQVILYVKIKTEYTTLFVLSEHE